MPKISQAAVDNSRGLPLFLLTVMPVGRGRRGMVLGPGPEAETGSTLMLLALVGRAWGAAGGGGAATGVLAFTGAAGAEVE
jgi:hypothetical protein